MASHPKIEFITDTMHGDKVFYDHGAGVYFATVDGERHERCMYGDLMRLLVAVAVNNLR
jgi:hypothetical protein